MSEEWDENDAAAAFAELMRKGTRRGGRDHWYWSDRPVAERGAVQAVLAALGLRVEGLRSREPGQDPPDCEAIIDGAPCGIEVTELVDQETLEASVRGPECHFVWDRDSLCDKLGSLIARKDVPAKLEGGPYARYVLVVHTDEWFLNREDVASFLTNTVFHTTLISDVYLALSYDPSIRKYPVFELKIERPVRSS